MGLEVQKIHFTPDEVKLIVMGIETVQADMKEAKETYWHRLSDEAKKYTEEILATVETIKPKIEALTGAIVLDAQPVTDEDIKEFTKPEKE